MTILLKKIVFASAFLLVFPVSAQVINNGDFNSGITGWGCNPETNAENVYGGPTGNTVAEVDATAGLCQTITGFTPGSVYQLSFQVSRRTSCGPTIQEMNVSIGPANLFVSRNGTPYGYTTETITFTASAASQTVTFSSPGTETCNLIVDDILLSLVSALPVELTDFSAFEQKEGFVELGWTTSPEMRNDYFTLGRSVDGSVWQDFATVKSKGANSMHSNTYLATDASPLAGMSYYRISQTDFDGKSEVLAIRSVECRASGTLSPNPFTERLRLSLQGENQGTAVINVRDVNGKVVASCATNENEVVFSGLESLGHGSYFLEISRNGKTEVLKAFK